MSEELHDDLQRLFRALSESARRVDELTARVDALEAKYADLSHQLRRQEAASLRGCLKERPFEVFVADEEFEGVPA